MPPLSKKHITHCTSLKLKKYREQHHEFIIEGIKSVDELIHSTLCIKYLFALPEWIENNEKLLHQKNIQAIEINEKELEKISLFQTPNQVVAIAEISLPTNLKPNTALTLILDDIKDPGNLGTIIRTAEWFGLNHIICSNTCVDAYNPKTVQAAMGSLFRMQIHYTDLPLFLKDNTLPVYGATMHGQNIYTVSLEKPAILIIGNEANGITKEVLPFITTPLTIPAYSSHTESLNASVATGILLATFIR